MNSWVYRAEYAAATIAILVLLFGWRGLILHELTWSDVLLFLFWAIWPDLVAFVPIGVFSKGSRTWPAWGPGLYNSVHNLLVWGGVFLAWTALTGQIAWPLLAWAGHITADRAVGYHLRAPVSAAVEG